MRSKNMLGVLKKIWVICTWTHIYTRARPHTHIYTYIYVCVCMYLFIVVYPPLCYATYIVLGSHYYGTSLTHMNSEWVPLIHCSWVKNVPYINYKVVFAIMYYVEEWLRKLNFSQFEKLKMGFTCMPPPQNGSWGN